MKNTEFSPVTWACPSYHCGVAAADELSDLVKDAFTVNAFVEGASLHDDRHRQQDLLANILLKTGKRKRESMLEPGKLTASSAEMNWMEKSKNNKSETEVLFPIAKSQLQLVFFGLYHTENFPSCYFYVF